jgi:hypothetical protein
VKTRHLSLVTHEHLDTVSESKRALSPYGPVRAGLTISQTTQSQQLSELLNSLESAVESLNYKSFTVYDTLNTAIEAVRAALLPTQTDAVGTDEVTRPIL